MARRATEVGDATAPIGRRRGPTKGDLKEQAILDTAWRLLSEKPVNEITIDELAKGAGITRSSFYFYFDSKASAMQAAIGRTMTENRDQAFELLDLDSMDLTFDVVRFAMRQYLDQWVQTGGAYRAMLVMAEADPTVRDYWQEGNAALVQDLAAVLERMRAEGKAAPGPPASVDLVEALIAMMWRTGMDNSIHGREDAETLDRQADTLATVVVRAVGLTP